MSNSPRWSSASDPCRFEWRPSRWLIGALCLLAVLAPASLLASDLPGQVAWPVAVAVLGYGAWLAYHASCDTAREVVIRNAGALVEIDGECVRDFRLHWRGALVFARWNDAGGRVGRLVWWPDTLPAAARRELRLAAPVETSPRDPTSMAP